MKRKNSSLDLSLYIEIAKIGKPKGLSGQFFITPFTDDLYAFAKKNTFFIVYANALREFELEKCVIQNKRVLAKAREINSRDEAEEIKNFSLYYPKTKLPKLENLDAYWYELIGMEVLNIENIKLGIVKEIKNFGSNDILHVQPNSGDAYLIPFVKSRVVLDINRKKNSILVDWDSESN